MKTIKFPGILVLFILLLVSCTTTEGGVSTAQPGAVENPEEAAAAPSPTPTMPAVTNITIDGNPTDWSKDNILLNDEEGDANDGGFDIATVWGFTNDGYFYLMISAVDSINDYMQIDLDIDTDNDQKMDYMVTFRPLEGSANLGTFKGDISEGRLLRSIEFAQEKTVEMKLPLKVINNKQDFTLLNIRVMNGTCCEKEWKMVDNTASVKVKHSKETEPTLSQKYTNWLVTPIKKGVSKAFIINDLDFNGARSLYLDRSEKVIYVASEFSGEVQRVNVDPKSLKFGSVEPVVGNLFILNDIALNTKETIIYLSREAGPNNPPKGINAITAYDLVSKETQLVTDKIGQPTNIVLSTKDPNQMYVVDLANGGLFRLDITSGKPERIAPTPNKPFAVAINQDETTAYLVNEPARAGEYPLGDLVKIDLKTGKNETVAAKVVFGASGITLSRDGKIAFFTEFGHEGKCDGALSAVDIDPNSATYAQKKVLLDKLCGPHDNEPNQVEDLLYFVEVDGSRLSVIRIDKTKIFSP